MDVIYSFIDTFNIPLLTAFLIGILTSISPCPLATNITAIAYISKDVKTPRQTLLNGFFYTFGRGISYTVIATLIYLGLSSFQVSRIFQGWGDKILGPALIVIGLIMFGKIKVNFNSKSQKMERFKIWMSTKGFLGALLLGVLFALAFCPYSGVLFFGVLTPLVLKSQEALLLPPIFALGTGLPVIIFSFLIAFGIKHLSRTFKIVTGVERILRIAVASIFIMVGVYYLQYLAMFLMDNFL